ncbi:hypothetical protein HJG60_008773 [Phyllostomus discolor]|uniref:Uncharacterized protein n=1 Tax=Phyllostomus discolor TaxID=89673 RepID=A0A834DJ51_9CHIR|nr:hypothetical protein HJG60_008773 [Phyllostomus discolor]
MAPVLAPPAPGTLQRPRPGFCALRLRRAQPTRRAPPPPESARTRARPLTIARVWWLTAPPRVQRWETFVPPPPTQLGPGGYGNVYHNTCPRAVTRAILTGALSHSPKHQELRALTPTLTCPDHVGELEGLIFTRCNRSNSDARRFF